MDQSVFDTTFKSPIETPAEPPLGTSRMTCPGCRKPMFQREVEGEQVWVCSTCDRLLAQRGNLHGIARSLGQGIVTGEAQVEDHMEGEIESVLGFLFQLDVARNVQLARQSLGSDEAMLPAEGVSREAMVEDVFICSRDGILLSAMTSSVQENMDEEILVAMIQAITDFVQESFTKYTLGAGLESIRFKGREIAFVRGDHLALALNLNGALEPSFRERLESTIHQIEASHGETLTDWNGDVHRLTELVQPLHDLFVPVVQ